MAHFTTMAGVEEVTGAIRKKKVRGVNQMSVTRRKKIKDPLTGEVVDLGPKEMYVLRKRDLKEHPLSENEKRNHGDSHSIPRRHAILLLPIRALDIYAFLNSSRNCSIRWMISS